MMKIIDNRMDAKGKDYLVFKVYKNPGNDHIFGYLIPHSEYDADEHLNFVQTERDIPVKEAYLEAIKVALPFGQDFDINFLWIQDLDDLFPVKDRPDTSHLFMDDDMLRAS